MMMLTEKLWVSHLREQHNVQTPHAIVAHQDAEYSADLEEQLERRGYQTHRARSGSVVRRLARRFDPELVVMDANLELESGWLTCAKLCRELPEVKVVLVGTIPSDEDERFAEFVGAVGIVDRFHGAQAVLELAEASESTASR